MMPQQTLGQVLPNAQAPIVPLADGIVAMMGFTAMLAACIDCAGRFESIFDADAHARSARHRVECDCRSAFTIAPIELFDGVR